MLRISEHKPEAVKPLADVQEQVKALVQHNKAEQQAKVDAEKLLVDLKAGKGAEAMQAAGLKFGEPKTLSRSGRDPISGRRLHCHCQRKTNRATVWRPICKVMWFCWRWMK